MYKKVKLNSCGNVNSKDKKITVTKKKTVMIIIAVKVITMIIRTLITKLRAITKPLEKD